MANQIEGSSKAQGAVSGLDQEELILQEAVALNEKARPGTARGESPRPGATPLGTGAADDAFGEPAGGPAAS